MSISSVITRALTETIARQGTVRIAFLVDERGRFDV